MAAGLLQALDLCRCWQSVVVPILSCLNCFSAKLSSTLHLQQDCLLAKYRELWWCCSINLFCFFISFFCEKPTKHSKYVLHFVCWKEGEEKNNNNEKNAKSVPLFFSKNCLSFVFICFKLESAKRLSFLSWRCDAERPSETFLDKMVNGELSVAEKMG